MSNNLDIGHAFLNNQRSKLPDNNEETILIGDPTFNLGLSNNLSKEFNLKQEIIENKIKITFEHSENDKINDYVSTQGDRIISYSIPTGNGVYRYNRYKRSDGYSSNQVEYFVKLEIPKNKKVKDVVAVNYINNNSEITKTIQYIFSKKLCYDNPLFSTYNHCNIIVLISEKNEEYYLDVTEISGDLDDIIVNEKIPSYAYEITLELEEIQ
jgi:hypothetical protein